MYPHNQPQVNLIPGNQPGLQTPASSPPAQRIFKEGKTLGALQILIGLIHFGLGSIMGTILLGPYRAPSFYGGYPFWGGISFIISGSLSVASEEQPNSPCVLKGGLGMNILSAIFSVMGICLFITDICINPHHFYYTLEKIQFQPSGFATSGILLIFSLLELCIASTCAHFGCQLVSYDTVVYQTFYVSNQVSNPEPVNLPPSYSSEARHSK
ncbi:membrane-spanning 4-domains subfamily A member 8-like isoform X3 [Phyllostomus hastatus]|nr:membrane-spanning 4-domains subfamily A member 8-like isoform X3 [Phyllostomus hastatus]XP_045711174.1 membrane-spanning 4-domains subfamily A member 8-like isoform X3 [Phyllostomus hastatus]XP_045711175.1 membrane-spanning 4-domains subfamily A member 8-like isoform X3 [Phyllostomus hastatus]XP_045711176.1 membrane-spanning 4-domains subfamily A member 8-like isoform X3 [Phyllostomus hastatus]XP_045711177.1 membrane-spanning 4-domains subfamily A member 8-like isoform X3 [Phyllostomus hasta